MTTREQILQLVVQYLTKWLVALDRDRAAFGRRKCKVEQEIRQGTRRSKGQLPV